MKITSIEIIEPRPVNGMRIVICKVNSDEDVYGYGEIGVAIGVGATAAKEVIKDIAPMIFGMNPLYNDVIWEKLYKQTFWGVGNGAIIMSAISAIDTALWDLKARFFGVPLYVLLGGKQRDQLRAYASQLQFGWNVQSFKTNSTVDEFREATEKAVAEGYTAVKANVLSSNSNGTRRHYLDTTAYLTHDIMHAAEERIAAMRNVLGSDRDLILENHAITDANTAIQFSKMAEKYDIMFLEEPSIPTNAKVFKRIADCCSIPLATGERTFLRWGFLPLITEGGVSVIQPDIGNCGGVTEFMKISSLARVYDIGVQAHVCSGPFSVAAALQCEAALPNFIIHEHHVINTFKENTDLGVYNYQPVDGFIDVPELPGLGQELSDYALKTSSITVLK